MNTNYSNVSMLDMVFEHRNKDYGAYVLRRDANQTTKRAMLAILSAITVFCFGNFIRESMHSTKKNMDKVITVSTADVGNVSPKAKKIETKITPPKPPKLAAAPIPTVANTEKRVVADNKAPSDSIPTNRGLANADPGIKTNTTAAPGIGISDGTGAGNVLDAAKEVQPVTPKVYNWTEKMPEFPGGDAALMKFIASNIDYPQMERENEIAGKVLTQFTVNEDGTISDILILKSPSAGFNKEVMRVVKKLPAFKPGIQQGRAVKVRFCLPVTFSLK